MTYTPDPRPRVLEPYGQTPQGTAGNPFWSTGGQQALPDGPGLSHAVPVQQPALSPAAVVEVEKIRERVLREAEQNCARELQKLEKGDSASYASANSAAVEREKTGALPPGGPPDVPPGLTGVFGGPRGPGDYSAMSGPPKPGPDSVTAFPEAMRNLELPTLPAPSGAAVWRLDDYYHAADG